MKNFSDTADAMIASGQYDSRRIKREVDEVKRKWNDFQNSISEYQRALDESQRFFELMDNVSNCLLTHGGSEQLLTYSWRM